MDILKEKLLQVTYDKFLDAGLNANSPTNVFDDLAVPDIMGLGTAVDENIFSISDLKELIIRQREQAKGIEIAWTTKPLKRWISKDENTALFIDNINFEIKLKKEIIKMPMRYSSVLEYQNNKWKVVHFHGSKPENVESEKDTWGIEDWKEKNAKLEKLVAEKTLDLQIKNRELEIEAALERVRARAMAMHSSNELAELVAILFKELTHLDVELTSCIIWSHDFEKRKDELWVASNEINKPAKPFFIHPFHQSFFNSILHAWKANDKHWEYELKGSEKEKFQEEFFKEVPFLPHALKSVLEDNANVFFSASFNQFGALEIISNQKLSEKSFNLLHRFGKEFNSTYTRFLDLQKAETQAREAQIEAALERVRSIAMGLNKSDDLLDVAEVLYHQLSKLGFNNIRNAIIDIHTDDEGGFLDYDYSSDMGKSITKMSYNDHPIIEKQVHEINASEDGFFEIILEGKDLEDLKLLRIKNGEKPDPRLDEATQLTYNLYSFGKGEIGISTFGLLTNSQKEVLKRFRNVFTFAYTRYSDLAQAEQLAKQAQIDLENLILAKKKTDEALIELKETQSQLIQSEKMASLGELTAGIAHEIQNPLNFVNNFSEVSNELLDEMMEEVAKGNFDEVKDILSDVKQNLEKINHHGRRADAIVKGMLQHSRTTNNAIKEPTDINALADEYLRLAYHGLRAKDKTFNATMKTDFDNSLEKINVIPQDLGRVILNLITNAFYVVDEKKKQLAELVEAPASALRQAQGTAFPDYEPTVTVSTKKINDKVEIIVADNGNGIPQKVLDKIFQPFFTTKPTGKGTGLGLSLSYDIVKAHGGELKVETKEGDGTIFSVILPS